MVVLWSFIQLLSKGGVCTLQLKLRCCNYSDGAGKQPLAIVGSPYWMAPEVLRGELYNEKVNL